MLGGCVWVENLVRVEVFFVRVERFYFKNNSFSVCCVYVIFGVDWKLFCFVLRWLWGCIWNIIWIVRVGWRRGLGVIEWWGVLGLRRFMVLKFWW